MNVQLLKLKIFHALRKDGYCAAFRKAIAYLRRIQEPDDFDVRYGTDTCGLLPLWALHISSQNRRFGTRYQATHEQDVIDAIHFLHVNLHTYAFIDLGCGKGRTLLIAAHMGFKQVIGVEFADELVQIARANLRKMNIVNAIVEHADAADFIFPNGDVVVYLYNPFSAEVMQTVVAHLRESHPRKLYVIYKVPESADVLDMSGFLGRVGCPPARPYIQIWKATD